MKRMLIWVMVFILFFELPACASHTPILIGLALELTGKQSDVAINVRDAAQLAVDTVNAQGGVRGRPLKLLIRDDQGKPEVARQVDAELVKAGVVAIIGHLTSTQTAAAIDQMNQAQVVLISPTSTSTQFTGQADYFFRLMPANDFGSRMFADYIYAERGVRRLVGVYDLNNRSYVETYWLSAQAEFESQGGDANTVFTFKSGETDLKELAAQIKSVQPEALWMVASAVDVAVISQYIRQAGLKIPLFAASWAQTAQLLEKGGQAINGLEICTDTNPNDESAPYQEFVRRFEERYGRAPLLATTQAYETVLALAHALEMTNGKAEGLPEAIIAIQDFPGIQGKVSFDHYGDVSRDVYIVQVQNGRFVTIKTLSPK